MESVGVLDGGFSPPCACVHRPWACGHWPCVCGLRSASVAGALRCGRGPRRRRPSALRLRAPLRVCGCGPVLWPGALASVAVGLGPGAEVRGFRAGVRRPRACGLRPGRVSTSPGACARRPRVYRGCTASAATVPCCGQGPGVCGRRPCVCGVCPAFVATVPALGPGAPAPAVRGSRACAADLACGLRPARVSTSPGACGHRPRVCGVAPRQRPGPVPRSGAPAPAAFAEPLRPRPPSGGQGPVLRPRPLSCGEGPGACGHRPRACGLRLALWPRSRAAVRAPGASCHRPRAWRRQALVGGRT
jgi:hypothetical protein